MKTLDSKLLENITGRSEFKDKLDNLLLDKFNFSQQEANKVRFNAFDASSSNIGLTEGAVIDYVSEYGIRAYIAKGTLKKALDKMSSSEQFEVNLGHRSESPLDVIGYFKKEDILLVDTGNGRQGLSVNFHFDEESLTYKELKRIGPFISLSAEFWILSHTYLELSVEDLKSLGFDSEYPMNILAITDLELDAFAVVKNPADINAFKNYKLSKLTMEDNTQEITKTEAVTEEVATEVVTEVVTTEETAEATTEVTTGGTITPESSTTEPANNETETVIEQVKEQLSSLSSTNLKLAAELNIEKEKNSKMEKEILSLKSTLSGLLEKSEPVLREEQKVDKLTAHIQQHLRI